MAVPSLIVQYGFLIVALVICAGELGLPTMIPGEIALLIAGGHLVHSAASLAVAILVLACLDLVATTTLHTVARSGGNRLLCHLVRRCGRNRRSPEEVLVGWHRRLGGRDVPMVFVTRLIPVFRMYASLTSGLMRIPVRDFLAGAAPAAVVWTATPLCLGYLLSGSASYVMHHYTRVSHAFLLVSVAAIILFCSAWWIVHRHRMGNSVLSFSRRSAA